MFWKGNLMRHAASHVKSFLHIFLEKKIFLFRRKQWQRWRLRIRKLLRWLGWWTRGEEGDHRGRDRDQSNIPPENYLPDNPVCPGLRGGGSQTEQAEHQAWPGAGALSHDYRLLRPAADLREVLWAHGSEILSSQQNVCGAFHEDICGHIQYGSQTRDGKAEVNAITEYHSVLRLYSSRESSQSNQMINWIHWTFVHFSLSLVCLIISIIHFVFQECGKILLSSSAHRRYWLGSVPSHQVEWGWYNLKFENFH